MVSLITNWLNKVKCRLTSLLRFCYGLHYEGLKQKDTDSLTLQFAYKHHIREVRIKSTRHLSMKENSISSQTSNHAIVIHCYQSLLRITPCFDSEESYNLPWIPLNGVYFPTYCKHISQTLLHKENSRSKYVDCYLRQFLGESAWMRDFAFGRSKIVLKSHFLLVIVLSSGMLYYVADWMLRNETLRRNCHTENQYRTPSCHADSI